MMRRMSGRAALLVLAVVVSIAAAHVKVAIAAPAGAAKVLGGAKGQSGSSIEGPVLGYVFNSVHRTIHPIQGITGAAQVGPALVSEVSFATVAVSPTHTFALGVEAGSGSAYYVELTPAAAKATTLGSINDGADRIVISPSGTAAIFYDRANREAQVVSGLPGDRKVRGPVALDSVPGVISALAVNDAGDAILIGVSEEEGGSVYLGGPSRDPRSLTNMGRVSSVAFLPDSNDAAVADYDRNEVILLTDVAGGGGSTVIGGERDGVMQPAVVAASADGASILVVSSQRGGITRLSTSGGLPNSLDCDCRPSNLMPLVGNAVFVVTETSASPLLVYDGDRELNGQPAPRIWFVPPSEATLVAEPTPSAPRRLPRGRSGR